MSFPGDVPNVIPSTDFQIGRLSAEQTAQKTQIEDIKAWMVEIDQKLDKALVAIAEENGGKARVGTLLKGFAALVGILVSLGTIVTATLHYLGVRT